MKNLLYLLTFFIITPITLGTSLFSLHVLSKSTAKQDLARAPVEKPHGGQVFAALGETGQVAGAATAADARVEIIRQYLEKYKSPLLPHAQEIVEISDKYALDFRLLVAIAQQESNLCKKAPEGSYNCWGWGIHSKGTLRFPNYSEAIEVVARGLREEYFNKGYTTPEEIMGKYTPLSPGTWAAGVTQFLQEME